MGGPLDLMWDTEELIRQIEPDLPSPVRVVEGGFEGKTEPWDAFWGQRSHICATRTGIRSPSSRHSDRSRPLNGVVRSVLRHAAHLNELLS